MTLAATPIETVNAHWPLSTAQRAIWLDLCVRADPLAYQLCGRARLDGELQPSLFREAIRWVVDQHDALRLRVDPHRPEQWLAPVGVLPPLRLHTLAPSAAKLQAELDALTRRIHAEPLTLDGGPLFAIDAVQLGPARWELLWRCSHLIADGLSVWLKIKHIAQSYNALLHAQPLPEPEGNPSFVATLPRSEVSPPSARGEADRLHWQARLSDLPPPLFEPRATLDAGGYQPVRWSLEGAAYRQWQAACVREDASPQRALLALLALAVGTRQNRDDVVVGMALHGRSRATRNVVGMFSSVLPVRCTWQGTQDRLIDMVQRVSGQLERDYRHQRLPVDEIGRLVGLSSRGQSRLFEVSLSYLPADADAVALPFGDAAATIERKILSTIVPLPLDVMEHAEAERLDFSLGHDPACLSHAEACALALCLQRTLQAFCDDAAQPVSALDPLSVAERQRALRDFQAPAAPLPRGRSLHALVRAQVRRTPLAVAVEDGSRQLSYTALDRLSDALARQLRPMLPASQAEPKVAVALPRSVETVVALLAILKAGAVYLPLDTAYPLQRLQYMIDDAQAGVLIDRLDLGTDGSDACRQTCLPQALRVQHWPDSTVRQAASSEAEVPGEEAGFDDQRLAYIIYTSGSSGEPKPVGVSHRAAVNLAAARQGHDPLGSGDKVLAAISVGFDVSIGQLLLPLLSGAGIVIAPPLQQLQADAFWALLARHGVSHINSVPSFFETVSEALVALPPAQRYTGLRRLMLGGEALTGPLASKLQQRLPGTQLVNMYGPTETCIDATAYVVPNTALPAALPIGRALPNYRAYVLDGLGRLAAPGVMGELCIAGAGVARGYLGREALTAEKFSADPFADDQVPMPDRRMYRSGDLARWREDGQLEFLGRSDQQVKIRGHRIETGEIEAVLLQHPHVRQAAVIAVADARGAMQLAAYAVPPADAAPPQNGRDVQAWLSERLPEHMVPATLTWLAALPLTTNGKLDRKALPAPQLDAVRQRRYEAPEGPVESLVANVWQTLLAVDKVGRDDNFFDLGGHSLLALAMVERLRQAGWRANVPALFADPTVRALAAICRPVDGPGLRAPANGIAADCTHITPELLPLVALTQPQIDRVVAHIPGGAAAVQDIYPLAPLQQGMLYHHLMRDEGDVFVSPFIVAFEQQADLSAFMAALAQVVHRHDILRTSIAWDGLPEPVQVVWRHAQLPLEDLGCTEASLALSTLQAKVDPHHHRIDLLRAPLLRAVTVQEGAAGRHLLALVLHHLALDHTSMEVVLQEAAVIRGGAAATLPVPKPFRDLVWQTRQADGDDRHASFFRSQLADVVRPTTPYGLASLPTEADRIDEHVLPLPAALVTALRARAREAGVGLASLMHLAYALVLARTSGSNDVVMGTVLLGRLGQADAASEGPALGMLINTLPLRIRLDDRTSLGDALRATQAGLSALMQHEHAPLALAQRCSGVAAPAPLFTALFNYRHTLPLGSGATAALGMAVVWGQERTGYPLALAVDDAGDSLSLTVQAMAPVDPAQVAALMSQALIAMLAPEPTPCAALDVLPAAEHQRLLHSFQPAPLAVPRHSLHALVQAQARRTPGAAAVVDGDRVVSYAELDTLSDDLALRLRAALDATANDAAHEPVVAVALPRSADTVVSLLAILKAGAVYLPLDLAYPPQRLQYMLDDAQAALLLEAQGSTPQLQAARLPAAGSAPCASAPSHWPDVDGSHLAYIIYTSGSTGQPKAVGVSHGAAVNLAHARQGHDPIGPGDRVLAAISVGFDVSIGQLLLPLLAGATVVIAPPLKQLAPEAFWALLAHHGVTHINSVPSFFDAVSEALMAQPEADRYRGLKRLMLGGEVLTGAMARKLQQRLPGTQLVNMYGPTEACIDATAYPVPSLGDLPAALPIGRPLPNYRAHVLDAQGRLAPVGVAGELCLAGAGLARGYIGRPEATAEKFVANPFAPPGSTDPRLYRTGDQARWRDDGQLEFLGRNDEQVKIRGFRVETGEVEAALLADPRVRQAAVVACKDAGAGAVMAYLAAYLVASGADQPDDDALRQQLGAQLPEHMVPQAFMWLPALPITPNGKLDRKALPTPNRRIATDAGSAVVAPRTALEALLLREWQRVFERQDIGVTDNFFDLGGHSLLAMRLLTACQAALREAQPASALAQAAGRLNLRQLLSAPSIETLALALDPAQQATRAGPLDTGPLVPLRATGARTPLFCVHPQGGTVMCFAELARLLPAEVPVLGLQAVGLEAGEMPLADITAMAQHYNAALQRAQPEGPVQLLGYSAGGVIAQDMARQLLAAGRTVALLAVLDSPVPQSPALRVAPSDADLLRDMVDTVLDDALAQRVLATARAMAHALVQHAAKPLDLGLCVVRATQRSDDLPDWQGLLVAPRQPEILDLDTDHHRLLNTAGSQAIAAWLAPRLLG